MSFRDISEVLFPRAALLTAAAGTVIFFVYCLSSEGRDERGRGIVGAACLHGMAVLGVLLLLMNVCSYFTPIAISYPYIFTKTFYIFAENLCIFTGNLCLVYNACMVTTLVSIAILRKVR